MKQLFQIKDEGGSENIQTVLSLLIGEKHISYAITDYNSKDVKQIAWDSAEVVNVSALEEWYNLHPTLKNDFSKIQLGYNFSQSTFISAADFQKEKEKEILMNFLDINNSSIIVSEPIIEWQLVNTYAIPVSIYNWVNEKFPAANYSNQYSVIIKSVNAAYAEGSLIIDFRPEEFSVIVKKQNNFLLAQTFCYSQPEDVIYYLMKIVQQYAISQQEVVLQLSGLIDWQSSLFKELYQYFINIEFREGDWILPPTEYPSHFFTSLNDLVRCV